MLTDQLGMGLLISLKDAFSANARTISTNVTGLDNTMAAAAKRMQWSANQMEGGLKMMGVGAAAMAAPAALIASSMATQKSLGALAAEGVKDLGMLENAATNFTNKWAGYNKVQFLDSAWEIKGAFANLTDEAVGTATSMAALTAKATRGSLESVTGAMTSGYGVFRQLNKEMNDQDWFAGFSGAMTQTVNAFRTDGNKMSLALRNLGAIGSALEIPMVAQMATLGTLMTDTEGEMAGTRLRALYLNMGKAGRELGFQTMGPGGQMLAMPELLKNIKARIGDIKGANLEKLRVPLGDEGLMALTSLDKYADQLPDSIAGIGKAFASGSAATLEAARLADNNFAGSIGVMGNRIRNLADELGKTQGQWAKPFVDLGNSALAAAQKMTAAHPVLVGVPIAAAVALGAITVAAGAARFAVGGMVFSFDALRMAASAASARAVASLIAVKAAAVQANAAMMFSGINTGVVIPRVSFGQAGLFGGLKQFVAQGGIGQMSRLGFVYADTAARGFLGGIRQGVVSVKGAIGTGLSGVFRTGPMGITGALMNGFQRVLGVVRIIGPTITAALSMGALQAAGGAITGLIASAGIGLAGLAAAAWPVTAAVAVIVAGVYVLWHVLQGAFKGFMAVLGPVFDTLGGVLMPVLGEIKTAFGGLMSAFGGAFGGSGFGGVLQALGQGIGWLIGTGLKPLIYIIGGTLWAAFKVISLTISAIAWTMREVVYWAKLAAHYLTFGKVAKPEWSTPTAPLATSVSKGTAQAAKAVVPTNVTAIPAAPRWYAAPARAAAAVAVTMAPMAQPAMAEPQSRPPARMLMMPVVSRALDEQARSGYRPGQQQGGAIVSELQTLRAEVARLADRPVDVNVTSVLDGRKVNQSIKQQNRIDSVRSGA